MDEDNLNLPMIVNDEAVDLRGDQFSKTQGSNGQNSSKKTNNAVKRAGDAGDKKSFELQDVNTARFKNFARNVSSATGKRNLTHRHRNAAKPNRPVSADPRFRRRRSPERLPNTPQSTAAFETTSDQLNDQIIKSRSASAPAFNMNHKRKHLERLTLAQETKTDLTQQNDVTLLNAISNYQSAIMDLKFNPRSDEEKIEYLKLYEKALNTVSISTPHMRKSKQISPYWNDPRFIKRVPVHQTRKSFTVPTSPPPTKAAKNGFTCPKCFCELEQTVYCESYKYDDCTAIDDGGFSEKTINTEFEKNPDLSTLSMILRSVCGLMIVSLFIWLANPTGLWRYYRANRVEEDTSTGFAYVAKTIAGVVLHGCDYIVTTGLRLLNLPQNNVYSHYNNNEKDDEYSYWTFFN